MIEGNKYELVGKRILLISPEYWGTNFVSKHHFTIQLSKKGNEVYFLNPPSKINNITQIKENIWIIDYKPKIRGLRFMPSIISGIIIKEEINYLESLTNSKFDIIWNFDSSRFFNLSLLTKKLRIAHIVDLSEKFERKLLSRTSDICLSTSNFIMDEMIKYNPRSYNIGHGYNASSDKLSPNERKKIDDQFSIKVGYIGNLSLKYIDWNTIFKLANEHPTIGFYFIGPSGQSNLGRNSICSNIYEKIKKFQNIIFLGEKPSNKIPAYLNLMDILLIIYKVDEFQYQIANPHKILDYLGSGKVIVSTWTAEYQNKKELIEMVKQNNLFHLKFRYVLENLGYYNGPVKRKLRKAYAFSHSYENKLTLIEKIINES